jgi:hypothetical protein
MNKCFKKQEYMNKEKRHTQYVDGIILLVVSLLSELMCRNINRSIPAVQDGVLTQTMHQVVERDIYKKRYVLLR